MTLITFHFFCRPLTSQISSYVQYMLAIVPRSGCLLLLANQYFECCLSTYSVTASYPVVQTKQISVSAASLN